MFNESNSSADPYVDFIAPMVKFWLFLVFLIPSIVCSVFVLTYLLVYQTLRRCLNNHVLIVLLVICLICQVTIYPWMLHFYRRREKWSRPLGFCIVWGFIDWGLYITQVVLFAWTSVERHILIFHDKWVSTSRKRFFVHYLPMALLLLYCLVYYSVVYFFSPCENTVDSYATVCARICLDSSYLLNMWETIVHQVIPNLSIIFFSIALLLRVLWRKHRIHQPIYCRKHRKMTIQLLSIALLYLIFSFPNTVLILMNLCGFQYDSDSRFKKCAEFFSYYILLLFPFVCAFSLPELRSKVKRIARRQGRVVAPAFNTRGQEQGMRRLDNTVS